MKKLLVTITAIITAITLTACSDASVASYNVARDADNFKIPRRLVFYNGITDQYILEVQGYCNLLDQENQLEVVCKMPDGGHKKHLLGLSDNVTYFAEQIEPAMVSENHYKVIFKPDLVVPEIETR